jgi:hypothetical protein
MSIDFNIVKPDGTKDKWIFMSAGSFGDITTVGERAGFDMNEYIALIKDTELSESHYGTILSLEDVKKILALYRKLLEVLEELHKKGIVLLGEIEEERVERDREEGRELPRERYESTRGTLQRLIDFFERAVEVNGSIIID